MRTKSRIVSEIEMFKIGGWIKIVLITYEMSGIYIEFLMKDFVEFRVEKLIIYTEI